jgi:ribosomal protein S18 acetylase RimI-like enzyme
LSDPSIRIRSARPGDNALLARLGAQTFGDTFGPDNTAEDMTAYLAQAFGPEKQAAELADPGTTFLIAEIEEQVVGYARLREGAAPRCIPADRPIEIVRFYAVAAWIGRGVGAALMPTCLEHARRSGCDVVWLDVWERNLRAIAFYRRWGFTEVGTQSFVLGTDVQRDLLMARSVETGAATRRVGT